MKTKMLMLGVVSCLLFVSCNKEESTTPINATDIAANAKIDDVSDDVLQIVESQSNNDSGAGRMSSASENFLSNCANISTDKTGNTWTRTIDFGATNCELYNGNSVRGKIILVFTNDFDATTRTITYTPENFYHNNRLVEGTRTVVKTILPNGHPQATINLNLKVTNTDGSIFTRVGTRVREFTDGYNTPNILADNVFSITGNWTTTLPSGIVHTTTITSPIIVKWNCRHIVSGTISFEKTHTTGILDYGGGTCDAKATVTINGVVREVILGN